MAKRLLEKWSWSEMSAQDIQAVADGLHAAQHTRILAITKAATDTTGLTQRRVSITGLGKSWVQTITNFACITYFHC